MKKKNWNKSPEITKVEGPCEQVSTADEMEAFAQMNKGKTAGPSGVTVEMLNVCKKKSVKRLAQVTNNMLEGSNKSECWRKSDLIPIFKGKEDVRSRGNYRSIKLLEHGLEVIERIFERRLRKAVELDEIHMGFMPGRDTTDALLMMRQLMENTRWLEEIHILYVGYLWILRKPLIVFQERRFNGD